MKDNKNLDLSFNPPEGTEECLRCNGYGSSFKDPFGVETCTKCKGSGLIKRKSE